MKSQTHREEAMDRKATDHKAPVEAEGETAEGHRWVEVMARHSECRAIVVRVAAVRAGGQMDRGQMARGQMARVLESVVEDRLRR